MSSPAARDDLVWYVSYGSNMLPARLRCYLVGGRPSGGRRVYPGARDPSPPARTAAVTLPGGVFFALESGAWTGGMAFYDPLHTGPTPAAAYLVTRGQFADITAQEMHREPGRDLPLDEVLARGRSSLGPGRYDTLQYLGEHRHRPMLTFTCPWRAAGVAANAPAPAYLRTIAAGIAHTHGWGPHRIAGHLARLSGVRGAWTRSTLHALVTATDTDSDPTGRGAGPAPPTRPDR